MKVGIDAHSAERDGTGNCTYIRGLLLGLSQIDKENQYILYAININHPFYKNLENSENFRIKPLKYKRPIFRIPISLAKESFVDKLDILHIQYNAPPVHRGKLILTIHDLAYIHFPEAFDRFQRYRLKILVPLNAKKAKRIICGSHYSKKDISEFCKVDEAKIEVIPYGVNSSCKTFESESKKRKEILAKYGIKEKFIFSLGRLNERKNLSSLISAYKYLRDAGKMDISLVIGGNKDFLFEKILMEIKNSGYENDIILTGYIDDKDLPVIFSSAELFVYPSLFEGFGLPPLEAMICKCPVIASNVSSIPEVVGNAGILVDPNNVDEISRAIYRVTSNPELREEMKKKGYEKGQMFRWETTAKKTLNIYEEEHKREK